MSESFTVARLSSKALHCVQPLCFVSQIMKVICSLPSCKFTLGIEIKIDVAAFFPLLNIGHIYLYLF